MNSRSAPLSNIRAEKALLGSLLRSDQSYWQVADLLRPDFFAAPLHRDIFSTIHDLLTTGNKNLSTTILCARLPEDAVGPDGEEVTLSAYLTTLAHNAEGLNATDFVDDIAETASRRQAIQIGEQLIKAARSGLKPMLDAAGEAEIGLLDVMRATSPKRPRRMGDLARSVVIGANRAQETDFLPGFDTGLPSLDEILGLILPADLIFIIASQGDGKTALAAQLGMRAAKFRPVLFYEMEMTSEQVAAREVATRAGMTVGEIFEGAFSYDGKEALKNAEISLEGYDFWIDDPEELTVRQIRAQGLAMKRTVGLGMVIIDQLDKLRSENRHKDRFERLAEVTRDLKKLAKVLDVPVITLAQRTRTAQRRDDPTPHILDADAPSIERDGDAVIGLWRKENWLRQNRPNGKAGGEEWDKWEAEVRRTSTISEVIVLKRRRGQAYQQRVLKWIGSQTMLAEL